MNHALTLRHPAPLRIGLLLMLSTALWLASAISFAPILGRTANATSHLQICKCAHCSGGPTCCCRLTGKCLAH